MGKKSNLRPKILILAIEMKRKNALKETKKISLHRIFAFLNLK